MADPDRQRDSCIHRYFPLRGCGASTHRGGGEQSNSTLERGEVSKGMKQGKGNERLSA